MDDELDLTDLDNNDEEPSRKDKRIIKLSQKVKETTEKETLANQKAQEEAEARSKAEKERDFFKGFNTITTKYPGANEYQDKILEKVNSGYEIEDATISIMAKEGKLQGMPTPTPEKEMAAGGSAATGITNNVEKHPSQMTQEERRSQLQEMESKGELRL